MTTRRAVILATVLLLTACARATSIHPQPPPGAVAPAPTQEPTPSAPTVAKLVASVTRSPAPYPERFQVSFADEQHGWLASFKSLRVTADGGRTWQDIHTFDEPISHAQPLTRTDGWVSTDKAFYATHDGGKTWAPVNTNGLHPGYFQFVSRNAGWADMRDQDMHRTTDGGKTWVALRGPCHPNAVFHFTSAASGWAVCVTGGGAGLETKDVYRTDDGGHTWDRVATNGTLPDLKGNLPLGSYLGGFFFLDGSHGWVGDAKGGIVVTYDGGATWSQLPRLRYRVDFLQFFTPTRGVMIVGQHYSEVHTLAVTADGGKTWSSLYPVAPAEPWTAKLAPDGRLWYGVGTAADPGAILMRDGETADWQQVGLLPVKSESQQVDAFGFIDRHTGWVAVEERQTTVLYRTEDGGQSWREMSTHADTRFTELDFVDATTGYAIGAHGSLHVTHDGGVTFTGLGMTSTALRFVSPTLGWAIADGKLRASTDGGATWQELPAPLGRVFSLDMLPDGSGAILAGDDITHQKLFVSQDHGKTWTWIDFGDKELEHVRLAGPGRAWVWDSLQSQAYYTSDGFRTWTPVTQRGPSR